MQHTPHLSETLENLFKGKLKESSHAFLEPAGPNVGLQRYVLSNGQEGAVMDLCIQASGCDYFRHWRRHL
jgi:hypothetical protein